MLVETMNYREVTNEVMRDYAFFTSGGRLDRIGEDYGHKRKKFKIKKESIYPVWYTLTAPSKNKWLHCLSKAPAIDYKGAADVNLLSLCYYFTGKGIRVFKINMSELGGISVYNGHFFTRYAERMGLNISEPLDKVKHYFNNNGYGMIQKQYADNREYTIERVKDGFALGEVQNERLWLVQKTFISDSEAKTGQFNIATDLVSGLQDQIEQEVNSHDFDKERFNFMADVMKGMIKQ